MSKELVAALALGFSLIASVFAGGIRIGTLTAQIETQGKQIDGMAGKLEALSLDVAGQRLEVMRILGAHLDPQPVRRTP